MKNKILKIALIIGLLFINTACIENEYNIVSVNHEITNYYYFLSENNDLMLINNYPLLKIGAKIDSNSIELKNMHIENESKSLTWDFEPKEITINNENFIGIDNINLASYNFDTGLYNFIIYDNSNKKVSTNINLINPFNNMLNLDLSLDNNKIIFTENNIDKFKNIMNPTDFNYKEKITISYFDENKIFLKSDENNNLIMNENFPFFIDLDKSIDAKYLNIEYKDNNFINTVILIELSSSYSSF